jgi:hypothetical protein
MMLQRTWKDNIGPCGTREHMTCWAFPLRLERQSSFLLPFVRFSYQFSSVICLFVACMKIIEIIIILFLQLYFDVALYFSCLICFCECKFALVCGLGTDYS